MLPICSRCNGRGVVSSGGAHIMCTQCNGQGVVYRKFKVPKCVKCGAVLLGSPIETDDNLCYDCMSDETDLFDK
jgi:hypothetical protein